MHSKRRVLRIGSIEEFFKSRRYGIEHVHEPQLPEPSLCGFNLECTDISVVEECVAAEVSVFDGVVINEREVSGHTLVGTESVQCGISDCAYRREMQWSGIDGFVPVEFGSSFAEIDDREWLPPIGSADGAAKQYFRGACGRVAGRY